MLRLRLIWTVLVLFSAVEAQEPLMMNVITFDGKSGYVELPQNLFDNLSEGTVETWVKWEKFNKWSRVLDFGIENRSFVIQTNNKDKAVNFRIWEGKRNDHGIKSKKILKQGAWHHLAAVFGRSGMAFYIDGVLVGTQGFEGGLDIGAGGNNYLGKSNWPKDKMFQGQMAELRVWNRRLSPGEIAKLKDRTLRGNEEGLVGYWRLGDVKEGQVPSAIAGGFPARAVGKVGLRTIPAIRPFLVSGQLEMAAEKVYNEAASAFSEGAFEQATSGFEAAIDLVSDFKDAEQRRIDAQQQWNLVEAEKAYTEAAGYTSSGQAARAYWAYDRVIEKVADYKDAATKREDALGNARFEVGLFVLASEKVREALTPEQASGGRFSRLAGSVSRLGQRRLQGSALEDQQSYAYRVLEDALDANRAPYIQLRRRGEMKRLIEQSGANAALAHYDQVLSGARDAGLDVLVLAEFTEAHTTVEKRQANQIFWTTQMEDYTDEKGKKRKREVEVKSYKAVRYWVEMDMTCTLRYRILNTGSGAVIGEGAFDASDRDEVDFINWNRYEEIEPSKLRVKGAKSFQRLSSDVRRAIDSRSTLKPEAEMYRVGAGYVAGELAGRLLETLTYFSP
jgi:tetratricopeptide (TPR) repeat protein